MRICSSCGVEKSLSEFSKKIKTKSGNQLYHSYCKQCHKKLRKSHYERNKYACISRSVHNKKVRADWFKEFKSTLQCLCCGESTSACLDFHHLNPANKDSTVSKLAMDGSIERLMEEIEKCVVLCANCHRKVHAGLLEVSRHSQEVRQEVSTL